MTEKDPAPGGVAERRGPSTGFGPEAVAERGPTGTEFERAGTTPSAFATTAFDRLPSAPRRARQYVTVVLGALHVPPALVELAVLVTSELVTNAVRHGKAGPVRLSVDLRADVLTLTVSDRTPYVPLPPAELPGDGAESGRGLALVALLSTRWGHRPAAGDPAHGTEVWAELPATPTEAAT